MHEPRTPSGLVRRILVVAAAALLPAPALAGGWIPSLADLRDLAETALALAELDPAEGAPTADATGPVPGADAVEPPDPQVLGEPERADPLAGGGAGDDSAGPWPAL